MTKKGVNKKSSSRKTTGSKDKDRKVEKILVENFVSLQKVMVNLTSKFDDLSKQISELLDSAKALVKKDFHEDKKETKELIDKLNSVVDQNKLIAKGLTLMHETAANPETHYSLAPARESGGEPSMPVRKEVSEPRVREEPELNVPRVPPQGMPKAPSDKKLP